eukprot:TRINITY_DN641_c0_g1_i4.p1 TRINITY_DN641_c0_g1~~TRINITY_DN641_c0_g1_i4.p1  ORF type:complete len:754 (+),score=199.16 TRINITY_DN641_c0_g1_i4:166-2262(+)
MQLLLPHPNPSQERQQHRGRVYRRPQEQEQEQEQEQQQQQQQQQQQREVVCFLHPNPSQEQQREVVCLWRVYEELAGGFSRVACAPVALALARAQRPAFDAAECYVALHFGRSRRSRSGGLSAMLGAESSAALEQAAEGTSPLGVVAGECTCEVHLWRGRASSRVARAVALTRALALAKALTACPAAALAVATGGQGLVPLFSVDHEEEGEEEDMEKEKVKAEEEGAEGAAGSATAPQDGPAPQEDAPLCCVVCRKRKHVADAPANEACGGRVAAPAKPPSTPTSVVPPMEFVLPTISITHPDHNTTQTTTTTTATTPNPLADNSTTTCGTSVVPGSSVVRRTVPTVPKMNLAGIAHDRHEQPEIARTRQALVPLLALSSHPDARTAHGHVSVPPLDFRAVVAGLDTTTDGDAPPSISRVRPAAVPPLALQEKVKAEAAPTDVETTAGTSSSALPSRCCDAGGSTTIDADNEGAISAEDVHKISQINDWLFLSSYRMTARKEDLQARGITHVLNCAGAACPPMHPRDFIYRSLDLRDNGLFEDILVLFFDVVQWLENLRLAHHRVLVHCYQGISRSSSFVVAYLIWKNGLRVDEALRFVRERRIVVEPNLGFGVQLSMWWDLLNAKGFPRLFRIRPHYASSDELLLVGESVPVSAESLDSRGCFVLHCAGGHLYAWAGAQCKPLLRPGIARLTTHLHK